MARNLSSLQIRPIQEVPQKQDSLPLLVTLVFMHVQIAEVVIVMDKWGFSYVENLTWVHMAPNNTVVAAPSLYARRSHLSLFIFRKSGDPSAQHIADCCKMSMLTECPLVDGVPHWQNHCQCRPEML